MARRAFNGLSGRPPLIVYSTSPTCRPAFSPGKFALTLLTKRWLSPSSTHVTPHVQSVGTETVCCGAPSLLIISARSSRTRSSCLLYPSGPRLNTSLPETSSSPVTRDFLFRIFRAPAKFSGRTPPILSSTSPTLTSSLSQWDSANTLSTTILPPLSINVNPLLQPLLPLGLLGTV